MNVTVLGAGSWGTALAILLARNGHDVLLWGHDAEHLQMIGNLRENVQYLPGFALPEGIRAGWTQDDLAPSDMWVVAVPSHAVRSVVPLIVGDAPQIVMASKGIETSTGHLLVHVAEELLPNCTTGVISGPNLAVEIVRGIPTAALAASRDIALAEKTRDAFNCRTYRVYTSDDVVGVEIAGALKNVLAIGAGVSDGLGFGDNTKGALLARGLQEMTTLGMAMGGRMETFLGVAGVGDLFATAASHLSRNYRVGRMIGEGMSLHDALETIGQVAEGVGTAEAAVMLSRRHDVRTPIFETVDGVLRGRIKPLEAVSMLMERASRSDVSPNSPT